MDQEQKQAEEQDSIDQNRSAEEVGEVVTSQQTEKPERTSSGAGLALLISVVALLAVAYLYFLNWQAQPNESQFGFDVAEWQLWRDEQATVAKDLNNTVVDIQSLQQTTEALNQQMAQQQQVLSGLQESLAGDDGTTSAFDNSNNEQAISQLQQTINDQQALLQALQQELQQASSQSQSTLNQTNPMGSALAASQAEMQRQAAIQTVLAVQMMVDSQRISAAIATLEQFNQHLKTDVDLQQQMGALAVTLRQTDLPDLDTAKATLTRLERAVDDLQVPTVESDDERAWYEKLVSIKKIDEHSPISSTAELMTLKMRLKQHLYEARLNLNLGQSSGWQQTLGEAANLIQQQLPSQASMAQSFRQLAKQHITPQLPDSYDIEATVAALKGS